VVARAGRHRPAPAFVVSQHEEDIGGATLLKEPVIWRFSSFTKTRAGRARQRLQYGQGVVAIRP
jgi:hypothetical protein